MDEGLACLPAPNLQDVLAVLHKSWMRICDLLSSHLVDVKRRCLLGVYGSTPHARDMRPCSAKNLGRIFDKTETMHAYQKEEPITSQTRKGTCWKGCCC